MTFKICPVGIGWLLVIRLSYIKINVDATFEIPYDPIIHSLGGLPHTLNLIRYKCIIHGYISLYSR